MSALVKLRAVNGGPFGEVRYKVYIQIAIIGGVGSLPSLGRT